MRRLWKVGLGKNAEYENDAVEKSLLTVDFGIRSNIGSATNRDALVKVMTDVFPNEKPKTHLNFAAQLNQFVNVMQVGDLVVSPMKTTSTIWVGRLSSSYQQHPDRGSPARTVDWLLKDLPRDVFKQDLLYSFGAFMTVCEIARNNALSRVEEVIRTGRDPGDGASPTFPRNGKQMHVVDATDQEIDDEAPVDLDRIARDQIERRIASTFAGHDLAILVGEVLKAKGMMVRVSPPGADGGVDIVAGSGELGLESPRIVVQVKSGNEIVDQPELQGLIGTVQDTKADYALCVSWKGFTSVVRKRTNELYFRVRFWGRKELVDNLLDVYDDLPEAIRAQLPLKRTWMLVPEQAEEG
jgi:restriction system protein